jgi:hypothetical protein
MSNPAVSDPNGCGAQDALHSRGEADAAVNQQRSMQMKTRTMAMRSRFTEPPRGEEVEDLQTCAIDDEDEMPCSAYLVMREEPHMPALQEYLREHAALTIH